MKSLRTKRQEEFAKVYLDHTNKERDGSMFWKALGSGGILDLCPRFGKCRVAINVFQSLGALTRILIAYPNVAIQDSWKEEFKKTGFNPKHVKFTTHRSLHKFNPKDFDIIVVDECHLLSEKQRGDLWKMRIGPIRILGLTGTLDSFTENDLLRHCVLPVCGKYSMDEGIKEKVITDYHITVKTIPLDTVQKVKYKASVRTEKEQFDAYSAVIEKLEKTGADTFYLRLARMRLIQASRGKIKATNDLLDTFKGERVLTFCGLIKSAEALKCPSYHSKSKNDKAFRDFTSGKGDNLAVVKIGDTGVTYKPLSKVIINYFDSNPENLCQKINRCMGMEYSNPGKKADIWIVSSDEPTEQKWLKKALKFFDPKKITYI